MTDIATVRAVLQARMEELSTRVQHVEEELTFKTIDPDQAPAADELPTERPAHSPVQESAQSSWPSTAHGVGILGVTLGLVMLLWAVRVRKPP